MQLHEHVSVVEGACYAFEIQTLLLLIQVHFCTLVAKGELRLVISGACYRYLIKILTKIYTKIIHRVLVIK